MLKYFLNQKTVFQLLQTIGNVETPDTTQVRVLEKDHEENVLRATGTTVPPDTESGYAKGCIFIDTDVAGGTSGIYQNKGTTSSCQFELIAAATGDIEDVIAGEGLVGGASSGAATLHRGIQIYNDTGGTLTKGTLVALSAYDTTNGITVVKADPTSDIVATHVLTADIANLATGNVYPVARVTGLDTSAGGIGQPVFADVATPGGFSIAAPSSPEHVQQIVGIIKVVHASTGEVEFFPGNRNVVGYTPDFFPEGLGASGKFIRKGALVVYDFAVDGGVAGTISLTDAPTIPDNAIVFVESYEVITTLTSATDAATVTLSLPTDGDLFTAVAISAGSNPWDQGVFNLGNGGALAGSTPKKCTANRVPQLTVAGGENLTAGKIIFQLSYWVSE